MKSFVVIKLASRQRRVVSEGVHSYTSLNTGPGFALLTDQAAFWQLLLGPQATSNLNRPAVGARGGQAVICCEITVLRESCFKFVASRPLEAIE